MVPEPARFATVALVGVMSAESNPVTGSLNVTVTGMGVQFVGSGAADVMATVGDAVSMMMTLFALRDPGAPGAGNVRLAL